MQEDKNYCVYLHRNKRTNEIFYVGSGRKRRVSETRGRCPEWKSLVAADDFIYEIIYEGLTKKESLEAELACYEEYSVDYKLVNVFKPALQILYDKEFFSNCLVYSEDSPTFLRWKTLGSNKANKRVIGVVAGGVSKGRAMLRIDGIQYSVHRIIWVMLLGDFCDGLVIDHIDGNPLNNRIDNLRLITQAENSRNTGKLKNNTTGIVGVSLHKNKQRKSNRWVAHFVDLNGKPKSKYFSILRYGNEEAFRLACEWRAEQIRLLNEQGAGYTERHGT